MYDDENLQGEILIDEYEDENYWYKLYQSGLLLQGGKSNIVNANSTVNLYKPYIDTNYTIELKDVSKETKYQQVRSKSAQALDATDDYNVYVTPINKTVSTQGIATPKVVSFKGPNKTANTELVTVDSSVGQATGSLNEIRLKLAVNQFITLKVDIPGAKINNLPSGFTFANSEITGAAKSAGEYRFNIVSEGNSVPVIMNVSNVIRIA